MIQFAEAFPDETIVASLRRQSGWTHFKAIIPIDDPLKRDYYAEMCRIERWSTRTLEKKIGSMLFERTALSRKPAKLPQMELNQLREEDKITPDLVFRGPYILDFLGLKDTYSEKDVEAAVLREMEAFILELEVGFCFLARQPYSLRLRFDDGLTRVIDFEPILGGELFGPLRDPAVFAQVTLDPEIHTLVWPCGADFDPATLHDWPEHEAAFRAAAERWRHSNANA